MAGGVTLTVDPQSAARVAANIRRIAELTGKETAKVVRNAARDVAYAGQRFTPPARRTDPASAGGGKVFAWIRHRSLSRAIRVPVPVSKANDYALWERFVGSRRRVLSRGFHKAGWSALLTGLGVPRRTSGGRNRGRGGNTAGRFTANRRGMNPIKPYEEMLHDVPGAVSQDSRHRFVAKALTFVAGRMDRSIAKLRARLEAAWRAAS